MDVGASLFDRGVPTDGRPTSTPNPDEVSTRREAIARLLERGTLPADVAARLSAGDGDENA